MKNVLFLGCRPNIKMNETIIIMEILLDKNLIPGDFSPSENLIKIIETEYDSRTWIDAKNIFSFDVEINKKIRVINFKEKVKFDAYLLKYDCSVRKKRHYLQAIFKKIEGTEIEIKKPYEVECKNVEFEEPYFKAK